ncbi:LysE family translocator [Bartonella tamiae]|uniref:Homoserine/Threonine efflux protein n=1 Tax=Bartonella tamiae Th239 TaxID=1094558 RepID=J0R5N7_9HYPH|nr:LysE family translocator [Bartonella tamiae]EJF90989.1 hypothetical protein ME5_00321 [Bartonella tamiae Th239]EJF93346.1 hypothetical protein MEG_01560 [Bartonella tamiae Th307]
MTFLPDWLTFIQFAGAVIILTLIPGPDMVLFVSRSIAQGKAAGFACIFGCSTGIIIQVIAVSIGLSALIIASPTAFLVLKISGALYLLWLAIKTIRHKSGFTLHQTQKAPLSFKRNFLTALGINLLNPKVLLFNMTFLPQFVHATDPYAGAKILFLGLSFIPIGFPINAVMVFAAHQFASLLKKNPLYVRILDWVSAGIFTAFALRLLATQTK